jgi:cytochrome c-type biogenesis protein
LSVLAAAVAGAWLGIITSISPCPLATNIAAVSFLARRLDSRRRALLGVVAYTAGRAVAYLAIGLAVGWGLAAAPETSRFLQGFLQPVLGPFLIAAGLVLLGWIPLRLDFGLSQSGTAEGLTRRGLPGAVLLGALFAVTFCPISAALFFGSLMPLALASASPILPILAYGIATALPVGVLALLIVLGAGSAARFMGGVNRWQPLLQKATAWVIVAAGAYLTLTGTLRLF